MGFLTKSSRIKELEAKAGNWDSLAAAVQESDPNLTIGQITPEMITDALSVDNAETDLGLQTKVNELQSNYETVVEERDELQQQVLNLQGSPAEDEAGIISDSEATGKPQDFATFAKKKSGDHAAILEQAKKEGLI